MDKIRWKHRLLGTLLFVIYLAGLSYFLFFAEALGRQGRSSANLRYNIVLFREIWRFWHYRHILGYRAFILNTFGNVFAFVPFGFFLPIVSGKRHSFFRSLIAGVLFSGLIETAQLLTRLGSFDVDDIFLNTIGVVAGYFIFRLFLRRLNRASA
ncbi:hypothetical protein HMPREF9623_00533 [Stomatobaculum longum]|jgi:glycopeptide antibiotics resistance protein|uniref:VanZ-like domain-containing protein n=1 Tax=Stomatobaculum longum TaxID=796942 RepID=A0AA37DGX9_9FIRM|nr:VanZ family protein [Stomatobaculum longum]EHO17679.1 hypothetical protein HMPREF9623_00533 [Stomatobaculum longum]